MNADESGETSSGNAPLIAAYAGSMEFLVPFVIEFGSARYVDEDGDTLLHAAADGWQYRMIEFLICADADVNAQNKNGDTPLHTLTRRRDAPKGPFISVAAPLLARSETFKALLFRRADTRVRNVQGANPLHLAAWNGDLIAIDRLAPSSSIDERTTKGATALALAVVNGHSSCAKRLIQLGADAEIELGSGHRIVDYLRASDDPNMSCLAP